MPAAERKSADRWDYEGKAVCVPLVSSSGHGKADIKRLHYQEGKFALANTMCAVFSKDEKILRTKFLHLFLSETCDDLLVPLMCGATNVTMDSSQLRDVLIPVPEPGIQDEVIESQLFSSTASELRFTANRLRESSNDPIMIEIANRVTREVESLTAAAQQRIAISRFLPT